MYDGLSRPQCSVLTQLRISHIGLNSFLHCFHLGPSPNCTHCHVPETASHFVLACPLCCQQHLELIHKVGTAHLSLWLLLGVNSDPKPVLVFVCDNGRRLC
ncbi:hypothetical protein DFH07DRAFT_742174 [Mycena maculata]|uniref:Reverse transcriptase zinc-binding domain-containing protein n=1 Tax=Mycena maculata TaxID=230809 RepID=A0AAD7NDG0_9AGAR|nr:hypothetical protein DFH07DRAFT_742174 [Mycena maculata]